MKEEKRPVGRPKKETSDRKKAVSISFSNDNLDMLDEIREDQTRSYFINRLIKDKYLGV